MSPNPIKEIQQTKDELAREAKYDVHRFFKNLRDWSGKNRLDRKPNPVQQKALIQSDAGRIANSE